jgi:cysteine desulfuration protein SufE
MTILEEQDNLVKEFVAYTDWEKRYQRIIDLGKALPALPESLKTEANKVRGCQSQVWLDAKLNDDGHVLYQVDSDAMIVRGLAALLVRVYSNHTPAEIIAANSDFLTQMGLTSHLSQSRANGLAAMVKQFKNYAIAFDYALKTPQPTN